MDIFSCTGRCNSTAESQGGNGETRVPTVELHTETTQCVLSTIGSLSFLLVCKKVCQMMEFAS